MQASARRRRPSGGLGACRPPRGLATMQRMRRAGLLPRTTLAAFGLVAAQVHASNVMPRVDASEWFACRSGKYAITLMTHYPSLRGIGQARVHELEVRQRDGGVTETVRRFEYTGMTLEVLVSSAEPSRYVLLAADVSSRRWNIGRLSVGQHPWRWGREKSLSQTPLQGWVELLGSDGSVQLRLAGGRVERVRYNCPLPRTA